MLARQRASEAGHVKAPSVRTEETAEFEVYERKADEVEEAPEPAAAPAAPVAPTAPPTRPKDADDFEELPGRDVPTESEAPPAFQATEAPEPVEVPEPGEPAIEAPAEPLEPEAAAAPVLEPPAEVAPVEKAPEPPVADAPKRRPQVWPPIRARTEPPTPSEPAAPAAPAAPTEAPRTHAPTPHAFAPMKADGNGCRLAIVQAQFNAEITDAMTETAVAHAAKAGATVTHRLTVPGVYDLPLTVQHMARRRDVDAVIVIGCVVSGETKHDELITFSTAKTLQEISLATDTPIGLGIIGPGMTWEQAEARVGNGAHAVEAALVQWRALQTV